MSIDNLKEECGVVGVFGDNEAANLTYLGLYALQHRGQEACGIVTVDDNKELHIHKSEELVGDTFNKNVIAQLTGDRAIGHVRYSTADGKGIQCVQPFSFDGVLGPLAIAHNGHLTNADELRSKLEAQGSIFQSTSDTEVFMHLIAKSTGETVKAKIADAMKQVKGAYSLVILTADALYAVRDTFGFRPLSLAKKDDAWIVASESCAFDLISAKFERDVEPGEIVEINSSGIKSCFPKGKDATPKAFCVFEIIYFSRPDSRIANTSIYELRKRIGKTLAKESSVEADLVIPVPDSGVPMALGYAEQEGIPFELGLIRNHYIGRTFIEPTQIIRDFGVRLKLNPVEQVLKGKRVVVIDDSIVRGTTSLKIIRMIKQAGAKEIHMRIGSPPITHSCYFGVDTPKRERLLAAQKNIEEMKDYIGVDSLAFISLDGLSNAVDDAKKETMCYGCFHGNYPEYVPSNQ